MRFLSLNEWKLLKEGGNAISSSRSITWIEAENLYKWVIENIVPILKISEQDIDVIGSYGKKKEGETHGDLDIVVSSKAIESNNNIESNEVLDFINNKISDMGIETTIMKGFNQVSIGAPILGTDDIAQVDLMLSPDLNWSKFIYHSPNFRNDESKYKGVFRNALIMAIVTETSKNILSKTPEGNVEELESNVVRYPAGIWKSRRSFKGKKGLIKTAKLLKDFDELITTDPEEVTDLIVGPEYSSKDILTFENLWSIIHSDNFIHKDKLQDIIKKYNQNLKSMGLPFPDETVLMYPDIFKR